MKGIYLITCTINGNRYVGSSNSIKYRWRKHRELLRANKHFNPYMQRSWNKYGGKMFKLSVLEEVENENDLRDREQHYLDALDPEFNITPYAHRPTTEGMEFSEEWRKNISEGNKRYWESLTDEERAERGKAAQHPHTEETKKLLSKRTTQAFADGKMPKRKPLTDEQKANILKGMEKDLKKRRKAAAKRQAEWEAGREERDMERRRKLSIANTGKKHSKETKEKLRKAAKKQMSDPEMQEKHQRAVLEAMQRPEVKEALANRPKQVFTKEHREKIGKAHRGRKNSPESIELMRQRRREWWAKKKAEEAAANTGD